MWCGIAGKRVERYSARAIAIAGVLLIVQARMVGSEDANPEPEQTTEAGLDFWF